MEKWKYGPVVPSVYHEYKRFGAFQITKQDIVKEYFHFENIENNSLGNIKIFKYQPQDIPELDANLLKKVIDRFSDVDIFDIVEKTHKQEPWKKYEKLISDGVQGIKYTNEEILNYFNNHPEELEWLK